MAWGRLLELKPADTYHEKALIHPKLSGSWGEAAPCCFFLWGLIGIGFGEYLFPAMPVLLSQLLGFLGLCRDAAVSPPKPSPLHAASAAAEGASACQVF